MIGKRCIPERLYDRTARHKRDSNRHANRNFDIRHGHMAVAAWVASVFANAGDALSRHGDIEIQQDRSRLHSRVRDQS